MAVPSLICCVGGCCTQPEICIIRSDGEPTIAEDASVLAGLIVTLDDLGGTVTVSLCGDRFPEAEAESASSKVTMSHENAPPSVGSPWSLVDFHIRSVPGSSRHGLVLLGTARQPFGTNDPDDLRRRNR